MTRKAAALVIGLMFLSACVSRSEQRLDEAWDICRYHKDPEPRARCVEQQMHKKSATDAAAAAAKRAVETAEERREAELEAQGLPRDAARGVD